MLRRGQVSWLGLVRPFNLSFEHSTFSVAFLSIQMLMSDPPFVEGATAGGSDWA
jgi:hypothetical protein